MTSGLLGQGAKCRTCGATRSREHDVSLAQAIDIHSIDNCVILGERCRGSTVAAKL